MSSTAAKKKAAAAKVAADKAFNASFDTNFGWLNALVGMDTTDPNKGFTLSEALNQLRTEKITDPNLAANILQKTDWYQKYGQGATERMALEKTNNGVFQTNLAKHKSDISKMAATKGYALSDADLNAIARDAYIYGDAYDQNVILDNIIAKGKPYSGGEYGNTVNDLKNAAFNYGVDHLTDQGFYDNAAAEVAKGTKTADYYVNILKDNAKSQYAAVADKIDAGLTVRQIANPYIQQMSSILELNPSEIDMTDPYISKAMTSLDEKNNPAMTPLWKFQQDLRQDPRWQKTQNAKDAYSSMARKVLTDMGLSS